MYLLTYAFITSEMVSFQATFMILLVLNQSYGKKTRCHLPQVGPNTIYQCSIENENIPCEKSVLFGTVLQFQCNEFYVLEENDSALECLHHGRWNHSVPNCVPECGKLASVIPLIVMGEVVPAGIVPWQAALYHNSKEEGWEFWCGGSLISERMVLTAAHCVWKIMPEDLKVALGKRWRDANVAGEESQMVQVMEVDLLESYQDVTGNYNGDLALLLLKESVTFNEAVRPACIDWDISYVDDQLVEGNSGVVLGWGLTENDTFSKELRAVRLPVTSDEHCIKQQQRDFKKFVTFTSFCAGYTNGTGVCNGDSGGGLAFLEPNTDTWYLQGVVSVSPRRKGTPFCDPKHFTVFTKVAMFTPWLAKMAEREKQNIKKDALDLVS